MGCEDHQRLGFHLDPCCPSCEEPEEPELYACKVCEEYFPEDELDDGTCDGCLEADHQRVESHSSIFL